MTSVVLPTTPAHCCVPFLPFVLAWLLFTLALMLIFGVASFVSFLLACFYSFFFFSSLPCSFSLSSSACLPPLALTGGYSSLGWAETASLYNTDRLLCNQIPSVATSEDSLSLFLHLTHTHTHSRRHTHAHAHTHTTSVPPTLEQCVCALFMYNDPCTYNHSTWFILGLQGGSRWSHFHHFLFFPALPLGVQRSLSSGISMFVLWLCVSARPWLLYQTGDSGL